jgi:hypothetical protein
MGARIAFVAWLGVLAARPAAAEVRITLHNGQVTLVATQATPRQILSEWERVGQIKIINIERAPGGPVTLEFTNVPEQEALDALLRGASGYVAATRAAMDPNVSRFDRIIIMPPSTAPRAAVPAPGAQQPFQPAFPGQFQGGQPPFPAGGQQLGPDDQEPSGQMQPRPPVFNSFPPPQVVPAQPSGMPAQAPGAPGEPTQQPPAQTPAPSTPMLTPGMPATVGSGAAAPGMIVQPPPTNRPGQPGGYPDARPPQQ